jgi:hypothetical protein
MVGLSTGFYKSIERKETPDKHVRVIKGKIHALLKKSKYKKVHIFIDAFYG